MHFNSTSYNHSGEATTGVTSWIDFQAIGIASALLYALLGTGDSASFLSPVRLVLGIWFVLYVPGYCLTAALFPATDHLDPIERLGLSVALSVTVVPLLALLIDHLPWGLGFWPILNAEFAASIICAIVALWRRHLLPSGVAYAPVLAGNTRGWWDRLSKVEQWIYRLIGTILLFTAIAVTGIMLIPSPDSFLTEFYMLGQYGRAEDYPREVAVGRPVEVTLGIRNHESAAHSYHIELWVSDVWQPDARTLVLQIDPQLIEPGQLREWPVSWVMPRAGDHQQIEILLYSDGGTQPHRRLVLWLNVRGEQVIE